MTLGFLGTGAITSAMVTGLSSTDEPGPSIRLSPRNEIIALELARRFPQVSVASSHQDVLDHCETVVLAVRPNIARSVLSELHFRPEHHVISVVSGLSVRALSSLVSPATRITRSVPLPSAANRRSPTAIYPHDSAAVALFASLGTTFEADTEDEFEAFCAATATIASYFAFAESIASWLAQRGISAAEARDYIAQIFSGLADNALAGPQRSFHSLAADHATPGGINEQVLSHLVERGVFKALSEGLDAVRQRIAAASH